MSTHALVTRICDINTQWTTVDRAHQAELTMASMARRNLLEKYHGAAWRYLLAATRDETVAEELFQEFALKLIRGDFCRVKQQCGRFRDYVKGVLVNLVKDHHRRRANEFRPLPEGIAAADSVAACDRDDTFLASWRAELLDRAWKAMERRNEVLYVVLRSHVQQPAATADEKAGVVGDQLQEAFTVNRFRVSLHRARDMFSKLLREEVARSLQEPTPDELRDELKQLRLLAYCDRGSDRDAVAPIIA